MKKTDKKPTLIPAVEVRKITEKVRDRQRKADIEATRKEALKERDAVLRDACRNIKKASEAGYTEATVQTEIEWVASDLNQVFSDAGYSCTVEEPEEDGEGPSYLITINWENAK